MAGTLPTDLGRVMMDTITAQDVDSLAAGTRVTIRAGVRWHGSPSGTVTGAPYADSLSTGVRFVPVTFDDGAVHNVDARVLVVDIPVTA